jgi:hypothetical protein
MKLPSKKVSGEVFKALADEVRACTVCAAHLPSGPRPVLQVHPEARILIAGQAPGVFSNTGMSPERAEIDDAKRVDRLQTRTVYGARVLGVHLRW